MKGLPANALPPTAHGSARSIPSLSPHPILPRSSLTDLEKGIQGLIVMSTSLEEIFNCIFDAHVPPLWGKARSLALDPLCPQSLGPGRHMAGCREPGVWSQIDSRWKSGSALPRLALHLLT